LESSDPRQVSSFEHIITGCDHVPRSHESCLF
jgi:hypothetical protein